MTIKQMCIVSILTVSAVLCLGFHAHAQTTPQTRPYLASVAETRFIDAGGVRYAYRAFGSEGGTPLILLNRLRGSMDNWDPALLEVIAAERRVIVFDTAGFARSTGTPPTTLVGFAAAAATFIEALGFKN